MTLYKDLKDANKKIDQTCTGATAKLLKQMAEASWLLAQEEADNLKKRIEERNKNLQK